MRISLCACVALLVLLLGARSAAPALAADQRVALGAEMSNSGPEAGAMQDPAALAVFTTHYDSLTAGNELKWAKVEPLRGRFDFSASQPFVALAEANGKEFRGHPLVWHQSIPQWLAARDPATLTGRLNPWTRPELIEVMRRHITAVVSQYKGRIDAWDVVNEPFNQDGTLRPSLFYRVIGPDYIRLAFEFAHQADPQAKLFLNDFGIEVENPKSDAVIELASQLREAGVPIDGIGSQTHIHAGSGLTPGDLAPVMNRVGELDLEFEVTELDVPIANPGAPGALETQASQYRAVANACQAASTCGRITMWGLTDAYSWLPAERVPLPFAANNSPKPAWHALTSELR